MSPRSARPATKAACAAVAALAGIGAGIGAGAFGAGPAVATTSPSAGRAQVAATTPSAAKSELAKARSFMPALGVPLTSKNLQALGKRDLVVVDAAEADAGDVKELKQDGALVLGYLSVGTVESWRPWFSKLKAYRLEPLGDWPGERYADVSNADARTALADDIAPSLLKKGFDGLFLDNVDMVSDHTKQQAGMLDLVGRLSTLVHSKGGLLMAQNGDDVIAPFIPLLDAWNREDATGTYDFDTKKYVLSDADGRRSARLTIGAMRTAGVVATTTDYYASPTSRGAKAAIRIACKAGAIPFAGDIALDTVPKAVAHY